MSSPSSSLRGAGILSLVGALTSGCVSISVHPAAVEAIRFEPRPPPADFVAHEVKPARNWLTKVGRVVGELELVDSVWSSHDTQEGWLQYVRGSVETKTATSFHFSCALREPDRHRQLVCFIRQNDTGERWLLGAAGRWPFGHRAGLLVGPRAHRFVTDAPVLHSERVFVYDLDGETPIAVGDSDHYYLPAETPLSERGPDLAVLLLGAIPFSFDRSDSFSDDLSTRHPPVRTEDGTLRVFEDFDRRFDGPLSSTAEPSIAPERAAWSPLIQSLEGAGAGQLAEFSRAWSTLERSCESEYHARRGRSRVLGFSAELSGNLGSNAALGRYAGEESGGAPVSGGFGISAGPTFFRRLVLQGEVGLSGPVTTGVGGGLSLPAELSGSVVFFAGPRARFVFTEPDDDLAFYLGAFHHWFTGSAGSLDEVARVPISGRGLGGFLGGEYCVVGSSFERFCAFSELGVQYRWLEPGTPTGEGALGEAIVEALRGQLRDTGGVVPELRLGVRFGF